MIAVPGYRMEIPNRVYGRNKTATTTSNSKLTIKEILLLQRYIEVTEEDVLETSKETAKSVWEKIVNGEPLEGRLEVLISSLPAPILYGISNEEEDYKTLLKRNTPVLSRKTKEPRSYLRVQQGILDIPRIVESKKEDNHTIDWYEWAFVDPEIRRMGLGEMLGIELRLTKNGGLPSKKEIVGAIRKGVVTSDSLSINRIGYDHDKIVEVLDRVYKGLRVPSFVRSVEDCTEKERARETFDTISRLQEGHGGENLAQLMQFVGSLSRGYFEKLDEMVGERLKFVDRLYAQRVREMYKREGVPSLASMEDKKREIN
tara:strand:+ start:79 stop:1023 length:945 start_codon:yes stop_codon:yes gene_type:complete